MFADGKTPRDKYTPLEIEIAKTLIEAKTQKEIVKKFGDYSDIVKDKEANMFDPAIAGKTRAEGIKEIFKTEDYAKPISERGGKTPVRKEELAAEPSPKPRAEKEKIAGKEAKKGVEEAYKDLTINQKRQIINSKFDELLKELKIEKICPT
jgi:PAB1-binding protein PBP1